MRVAIFATAWIGFAALLAPDVAFRDSGELGGAAWQLGIAHPTGFSLDMLWLHTWTWLPVGSAAFRMSLGVAFASAVALVLLFDVVERVSQRERAIGGIVAVAALGTFATFLGTATLIEVYSTSLLLSLAALREHVGVRPRVPVLVAIAGLAIGAHVTAWLACSTVLLATLVARRRTVVVRGWLVASVLGTLVVALGVAYLPLRSTADPAFDWGDPQTPARVWEHLSAGRIRTAFADSETDARPFFRQLVELAWCVPLAALAIARARLVVPIVVLLALDVAYATFVNPMGIVDRQVGHLAGAMLAALAGVGIDTVLSRPSLHPIAILVGGVALGLGLLCSAVHTDLEADGSDAMLGGGGVLGVLPPRSVYVCSSDDACAAALFARYAVGERPDVTVLVAQHLWEPRERAKLSELGPDASRPETGSARAELVQRTVARVASSTRPIRFEDEAAIPFRDRLRATEPLTSSLTTSHPNVDQLWSTFFRARTASSRRGRDIIARGYEALGRSHLRDEALEATRDAFARSVVASPERAVGWVNLAVVAARAGRLEEAITMTELATRLEPTRVTAWTNLARYRAAIDPHAGLATLDQAAEHVAESALARARDELGRNAR